ncbi:MAG: hypothetical protein K0V04_04390 [Deltaproteobacteria bacterium]|nr:hypothetical protein [Deltaproteobacteria bacterium]
MNSLRFIGLGILSSLLACAAPGQGRKARQGYAQAESIIVGLDGYREDNGQYPGRLVDLVPKYIPIVPMSAQGKDFQYIGNGDSYMLSFVYTGPGLNHCTYPSQRRAWTCGGMF